MSKGRRREPERFPNGKVGTLWVVLDYKLKWKLIINVSICWYK